MLAEPARPCRHSAWGSLAGRRDRAIDQFGQVIDVFVSARRDLRAARRFFERVVAIGTPKAISSQVVTDQMLLLAATKTGPISTTAGSLGNDDLVDSRVVVPEGASGSRGWQAVHPRPVPPAVLGWG